MPIYDLTNNKNEGYATDKVINVRLTYILSIIIPERVIYWYVT